VSVAYFDNNATTPLDSRVRERMLPWLGERHGNPSSVHWFGRAAREAVEAARQEVSLLIGASPDRLVFTSSGTEANNAVLFGCCSRESKGHLVVSALEHPSVLVAARRLEAWGWEVTRVPADSEGRVAASAVDVALRDDTALACLMLANNELGTIQPVREAAALCREAGVPVLCDAVQAAGKMAVDVDGLGVDFLTIGAHKFHGPLGAAALWSRAGSDIEPYLLGGGQERRRRAGTENVAAIVGFGAAAELARQELDERIRHMSALRDRFEDLASRLAEVRIHGRGAERLPNTSNLAFLGLSAESLMIRLDLRGVAVSAGSACSSGKVEPSVSLAAIGVDADEAASSMRVSFGMTNSMAEVEEFMEILAEEIGALTGALPGTR
jgi:cysteine desulfurase